jgi:hypothetical protein
LEHAWAAVSRTVIASQRRFVISVTLGMIAGAVTFVDRARPRDFGQVWYATRALLRGVDPYALIGPGRTYDWGCSLLYPLPGVLTTIPLASFPGTVANTIFAVIAGTAFAWALMEHGYEPLLGFASASAYFAFEVVQWSPLLTGAAVILPLGVMLIAKPTVGAAIFAARPSWWPVVGGIVLTALAFAIQPAWLSHWVQAAREPCVPATPYRAPVVIPGGAIALLCLLRWRRPEARLVAALACVPQTLLLYETVPLFLVPRTIREAGILTVLSYAGIWWLQHQKVASAAHRLELSGQMIVLLFYVPCTLMVLKRPNEGA